MDSILLLVVGIGLLITIVGLSFLHQSLQVQRDGLMSAEDTMEQLAEEVQLLRDTQTDLATQYEQSSKRYERLLDRYRAMEAQLITNRSYDYAIRMVKSGAKLGDLVDMCGLSPGEAKLVASLHQSRPSESST